MSLKPYPAYKDSGVAWLGDVPEHWQVQRLKLAFTVTASNVDKKSYDDQRSIRLCNYTDVYYNEKITSALDFMEATATDEQIEKFTLRSGDVIITKDSETADDIAIPAYVPSDLPGVICGYHLSMIRPKGGNDGLFLKYLFECDYLKACWEVLANGLTRVGLGQSAIENVVLPIPSTSEQTAIALFLDRETGKIDELIAEQEKLIELLAEKRQATISHAVTKGLNPAALMKDSSVAWLGQIPAHWDVVSTGYRYEVQLGRMLNEERSQGPDMRPYLRVIDVQWGKINVEDLPLMDFPPDAQLRYRLKAGDLIVNEGGSYVGRSAIWRGDIDECYYQKALHRLRPWNCDRDTAEFFLSVMENATNLGVFVAGGNQTTIDHLTADQLRKHRFAFPPLSEQRSIVEFLGNELSKVDDLNAEASRVIDLLKERRTALISAAVTGKIDVRDAVAEQVAA
jgi:type I restriction enzyme S subunit